MKNVAGRCFIVIIILTGLAFVLPGCKKSSSGSSGALAALAGKGSISATLVGEWLFSGNANDTSGNGLNGTASSGATLTYDRFNNPDSAYRLNGTDGYITVPDNDLMHFGTGDFSITLWAKYRAQDLAGPTNYAVLVDKTITDSPYNGFALFADNASHTETKRKVMGMLDLTNYTDSSSPISYNTWHFFSLVRSGTALNVYVDGALSATGTIGSIDVNSTNALSFGANCVNTAVQNLDGVIDDIRLYSGALTGSDIHTLYHENGYNPTIFDGILAYYTFSGNASDDSVGGHDGTVAGGAALTADRYGEANSAYIFDGIDDGIATTYDHVIPLTDPNLTVAFWVKLPDPVVDSIKWIVLSAEFSTWTNGASIGLSIETTVIGTEKAYITGTAGEWVHFVGTYDGSNIRAYKNGVLEMSFSNPGTLPDYEPWVLRLPYAGSTYWKGSLDSVAVWNRVLSSSEIHDLYELRD